MQHFYLSLEEFFFHTLNCQRLQSERDNVMKFYKIDEFR